MMMNSWSMVAFFAVTLAWAKMHQSRKTYRLLWAVAASVVFLVGLAL